MNKVEKSYQAHECSHCGTTDRMDFIDSFFDEKGCEAGSLYVLQKCPACKKLLLVYGDWHDGMEEEDWHSNILLPDPCDRIARQIFKDYELDRKYMMLAIQEAKRSIAENSDTKPKVGAVVAKQGEILAFGHRCELSAGDHAEYTVIEGKCKDKTLAGATVYTTLEPCTTRNPPKIPCVDRLIGRKVARVVIGMLDPDERIRGRGILALRKANIRVDLFPPDLMTELEEMNREFIHAKESGIKRDTSKLDTE